MHTEPSSPVAHTDSLPAREPAGFAAGPRDAIALLVIASVFIIGWVAVSGGRNVAVMDDWLYAGSVEQLLTTGRLRIAEFSAIYPIAHILWGALFCRVLGFSFGALRASTVSLSMAGCASLYATLRHIGRDVRTSLLVVLAVALNPVFFALSFSFMTDVTFVAVSLIAIWLYVSGVRMEQPVRWWIAAAVSLAAFLIRPVALALPLAALFALDAPHRRVKWAVPIAASAAAMAAGWVLLPRLFGPLDFAAQRLEWMRYWTLVSPREYAEWNFGLLFTVAFPLAPLLLAAMWTRRTVVRVAVVALVLGLGARVFLGGLPALLTTSQTWSLRDLAARALIPGDVASLAWTPRMASALPIVGIVTLAAFVLALVTLRSAAGEHRTRLVLIAFGAGQFALVNLLWLYNDRYYLVLLPVAAYIASRLGPLRPALAVALLSLWGVIAVTGTRDLLAFNEACATAAARLEAEGIPAADIDAGYVSNGWRLYMHPERLGPGRDRRKDVSFVTSDQARPYAIANSVEPGTDIIETIPLPGASWQATDRIYVLKRR